jgi:general stress protein YciG
MVGTKAGGLKAAKKNIAKNPNFYRDAGRIGGMVTGVEKGFAANRELARLAGAKGGRISRLKKVVK